MTRCPTCGPKRCRACAGRLASRTRAALQHTPGSKVALHLQAHKALTWAFQTAQKAQREAQQPTASWWIVPTREAFQAAASQQRARICAQGGSTHPQERE